MDAREITVLMTTYNCAPFIGQAIKSILFQSYTVFELLIIDDGSIDNTEHIVKRFIDKRILYRKIEHLGRSKALNYGLNYCANDWVALMDADDISDPKRLEIQIALLSGAENEVCFTDAAFFKNDKIIFTIRNNFKSKSINEILSLHGHFTNSTFIFNKKHIQKFGGYNESVKVLEDYDLWLRIKDKSKFILVDKVLQFARIRKDSLTRGYLKNLNSKFYEIQRPYFIDLNFSFGIVSIDSQNNVLGWREFFYGNKNLCRKYWQKIKIAQWDYRMFIAYLISFFPDEIVNSVKKQKFRLRLQYLAKNNQSIMY